MDRKHFKCLLWKVLWGISALSFIAAWVSLMSAPLLGIDAAVWFGNALMFVLLSIPIKMDCVGCNTCEVNSSK